MNYKNRVVRIIPQSRKDYDRTKYLLETQPFYPKDIPDLYLSDQDKIDGTVNPAVENYDFRQLFIYMWPLVEEIGFLVYTRDVTNNEDFRNEYMQDQDWIDLGLEEAPLIEMFDFTDIRMGRRTLTGRFVFKTWDYQLYNNR